MADDRLIASLQAAVIATPEDVVLRLHLADLLLDAGRIEEASSQFLSVLTFAPDHLNALLGAAKCSDLLHRPTQATAYRRLADLVSNRAKASAPEPDPPDDAAPDPATDSATDPEPDGGHAGILPAPEDYDDFLTDLIAKADAEVGRPHLSLADIGGLDSVKQRLQASFLGAARSSRLRKGSRPTLQGGLLLYGPPGCGKNFIAKSLAGEIGARFHPVLLADIFHMWLGNPEKAVHESFEKARQFAPCVLFLDGIDKLSTKRSSSTRSTGRAAVVQLITELDGANSNNDGLFVLGATDQPWDVDPALRRTGRFDRTVLVLPPDRAARRAVIVAELKEQHTRDDVDPDWIAARTEGFSVADLRTLCERAAEDAVVESISTGASRKIGQAQFKSALRVVRPSTGAWFDAARNYATSANETGVYDELMAYMRQRKVR